METVSAAMWRVEQAAQAAPVILARHRATIPGLSRIEERLVPAIEVWVPATHASRAFNNQRRRDVASHDPAVRALHRRCLFWLTYVRMDAPGYDAAEAGGRLDSAVVAIDRGRSLIDFVRLLPAEQEPPYYAEQMVAEITPLLDQVVRDREDSQNIARERQRLQSEARELMTPVYRGVVSARVLLRNALGPSHPDVRALNTDGPTRSKKKETPKAA